GGHSRVSARMIREALGQYRRIQPRHDGFSHLRGRRHETISRRSAVLLTAVGAALSSLILLPRVTAYLDEKPANMHQANMQQTKDAQPVVSKGLSDVTAL